MNGKKQIATKEIHWLSEESRVKERKGKKKTKKRKNEGKTISPPLSLHHLHRVTLHAQWWRHCAARPSFAFHFSVFVCFCLFSLKNLTANQVPSYPTCQTPLDVFIFLTPPHKQDAKEKRRQDRLRSDL